MKRFLLSCSLALGMSVSAQYSSLQNFDDDVTGTYHFGNGTFNTTAANVCSGTTTGALAFTTAAPQTGWMTDLEELGQTGNGQAVTVSINYKKAANLTGSLYVAYFEYNADTDQWSVTPVGSPRALTTGAVTTCTPFSVTIPSGTLDPAKQYGLGIWVVRTAGSGLYVDDLSIQQQVVTTAPSCTTFTSPTNGAVISAGQPSITWAAAATAVNYKLTIGTTPGGSQVFNGTVNGTSYAFPATVNTTYYAKVVPSNTSGDATGCTEITFSTNNTVSYCTASGPASAQYDKITNVTFANINNNSPGSTTPYPPGYEDFTSVVGNVNKESTYGLVVKSDRVYTGDVIRAFIDYNNNGTFGDAGELVATINVTANSTAYTSATTNITIPTSATEGSTRMRVLVYDSTATFTSTLATTGCGTAAYGQVEDYTLNISGPVMAVSDVNKAGITVYPNPFTDVLKISDVKGVKSVSINDVSGREVKSLAPSAELNLSSLKSGLYIVNLKMEDGSLKTFKAIKK
ncbi:GEVED domain-containing protein [Epilithonimonas hungarica]|uniref:Por secretion system C-terminal sorting domain-containing protein n=1 Tax=Epilithonimonas hungarica TaxID=454006 RepID=A0A1G7HC23_9FLAO|nr:GEVED domain-containing protein [Epilithonimonas hungarica]SDE98010.1 Por secretion system C-terminal sorting domain-containing protein [Epilithonimonas hungarica]